MFISFVLPNTSKYIKIHTLNNAQLIKIWHALLLAIWFSFSCNYCLLYFLPFNFLPLTFLPKTILHTLRRYYFDDIVCFCRWLSETYWLLHWSHFLQCVIPCVTLCAFADGFSVQMRSCIAHTCVVSLPNEWANACLNFQPYWMIYRTVHNCATSPLSATLCAFADELSVQMSNCIGHTCVVSPQSEWASAFLNFHYH